MKKTKDVYTPFLDSCLIVTMICLSRQTLNVLAKAKKEKKNLVAFSNLLFNLFYLFHIMCSHL